MSTVTIQNKKLRCADCRSSNMDVMDLPKDAEIVAARCLDCGSGFRIAGTETRVSIVRMGKISPAKSMYKPVDRGSGSKGVSKLRRPGRRPSSGIPSSMEKAFPKSIWTLEDPADASDRLIKVDDKGYERGHTFSSEQESNAALRAFKKGELWKGYLIVPADVWFLAVSTTERSTELRSSTPLQRRMRAMEIAKREMGWKDFRFDPTLVPSDDEIKRELENLHRYIPAHVIRAALSVVAKHGDSNPSLARSVKKLAMDDLSSFVGAPLARIRPAIKRKQVVRVARLTLDVAQRAANLQTLCAMADMVQAALYFDNIRTATLKFRNELRSAAFLPKFYALRPETQVKLAEIVEVMESMDSVVLDALRAETRQPFPTALNGSGKLRFAHVVTAIDMGDEYDKEPSDDGEKLINLALELGMDSKYESEEELLHDLTYLARGLGHKVDLKDKKDVKPVATTLASACKSADTQTVEFVDEAFSSFIPVLAWLVNNSVVMAELPFDPKEEKRELDTIVENLSVKSRKDATDLLVKWGRDSLLFMDQVTRSTMCKALIRIVREFNVKPLDLWSKMLEDPKYFDKLRDDEIMSDPLEREEEDGPTLDLADEFKKSLGI